VGHSMFDELDLEELRELLRELERRQAETERLIRAMNDRIDATVAGLERRREPRFTGATTENTGSYLKEEHRSRRGCIGGRMQPAFHHGLLGLPLR
jgi:hypothetical protein